MKFIHWHDFRVIYSESPVLKSLCEHPACYAPLLTVKGLPSNQFTNAYDWQGVNATTLVANNTFANTAAGCGQQYANAYLHTMKFKFNNTLDGSIPFCVWPNAWGFSQGDNTNAGPTDVRWLTDRDPHFVRIGRNDGDLLPATYLGDPVDARARGGSGYTANGIAANYAWWTDFWTAAKAYIDTALGHTNTIVEIYDGIDFPLAPDLNYILRNISTGSTHRVIDVIRADPRWNTELVNGVQTWADFYATLTSGERSQLENPSNTSLFSDALTTVAEKLGVFRDSCTTYQVDQTMVRAAREVFGVRLRFICEYDIMPQTPSKGTVNDRTVSAFTDRIFENRGPLTLPPDWGASPVMYQYFGLRDNSTGGNLDKLSSIFGYARTGGPIPNFGEAGGAAADGRLFNMARLKENITRVTDLGVETVPWWNYIPARGVQTGIVPTIPMNTEDHLDVLRHWSNRGVNRIIIWGDPARNYNTNPDNGPVIGYYESDFKIILDEILPFFSEASTMITPGETGNAQVPTSDTIFALFFDAEQSGRPCSGLMVKAETADVEIYFDTIASSTNPIILEAGTGYTQIADMNSGIRKAYVRGPNTAAFSWFVNIR